MKQFMSDVWWGFTHPGYVIRTEIMYWTRKVREYVA